MKQVYSGAGVNTTSSVLAYLNSQNSGKGISLCNLYIIGTPENPYSLFLTDCPTGGPVTYELYPQQQFSQASITRGDIPCKIGLDSDSISLSWAPAPGTYSNLVGSADPRVLAQQGFYDNWPVTILAAFMPTPGDVNTLGCTVLFKGIIASTKINRKQIAWNVNSLMVLLDQQVPTTLIEATNSLANYGAATPPSGFSSVPQFTTFTGSTDTIIYGDVLPPFGSGHIFTANTFVGGYLIFIPGTGSTEQGFWGAIAANSDFVDGGGNHHNQFQIYQPLPWAPTPFSGSSGDQFVVSAPVPTVGGYGFEFVPAPNSQA